MFSFMFLLVAFNFRIFGSDECEETLTPVLVSMIVEGDKYVYLYAHPTSANEADKEEDKLRIGIAQEKLKFLKSKAALQECLKKFKKDAVKNNHGIPVDCESVAHDFIICGGYEDYVDLTKKLRSFNG